MTRKRVLVKQQKPQKFKVREYAGASGAAGRAVTTGKFGLCRICLRELAHEGRSPA